MIILFDLDGTLIDSTEAILESFGVAFKGFNKPVPLDEKIKAEIGHPLEVMFRTLGIEEKETALYVHAYKEHYRKIFCAKTVLLPDAMKAIELASKSATLGVVTTKTGKYSKELLEYFEVMHYFDVLIGSEDVINLKPHPEPIEKALKNLPKDTEVYMLGDTCMDMHSAKASNVNAIGVTCGYGSEKSLKLCADKVYKNALEAMKFIVK